MSKFLLYGGLLGAVSMLTLIGFLWWQNSSLQDKNEQLNTELSTALSAIELQQETIEENERQQAIVNRNMRQLNAEIAEIENREEEKSLTLKDDVSTEDLNKFMRQLNNRIERATR